MTPKYFGEQNERVHGARLVWPGGPAGYPVIDMGGGGGGVGMLRDSQFARTEIVYRFRAGEFRTWDPDSAAAYQEVLDRCANGQFRLRQQLNHYDETHGGWVFWLEWLQQYETATPPGFPGGGGRGARQ